MKKKYSIINNLFYMFKTTWKKDKSVIFFAVATSLVAVAIQLAELFIAPSILSALETRVSLGHLLMTIGFFTATLLILNALTGYLNENKTTYKLSLSVHFSAMLKKKICTTSFCNLDDTDFIKRSSYASGVYFNGSGNLESFWITSSEFLRNVLGFIVYLFLLTVLEPWLMIIVSVSTVVAFLIQQKIQDYRAKHEDTLRSFHGKLYYTRKRAEDMVFAKDIRLFGMNDWVNDVFTSVLNLYYDFLHKEARVLFVADIVEFLVNLLRGGLAYYFCIMITLEQNLSASQFLLYFTAIGGFSAWISGILKNVLVLHRASIDLSVIRDFLDQDEIFPLDSGKSIEPISKKYEISLKNVSFRYSGANKDTIHNINLTIAKGEKIAIVGLNGAGKTTLIKLICGLYDPSEGVVCLDGEDVKQYNRNDYYKHFSTVFQHFTVLQTSVVQNITQAKEVDLDRVNECVNLSGLNKVIDKLPNKLDTHIGRSVFEDGIELSGGQVQRLMLARALYKNAPILLLDEPTAALDPIAERDMYERYSKLTSESTSVFISHRLASTRFCDRILYMENGKIIEEGSHDELLELGGKYADLFALQSKYYVEGAMTDE